MRSSTRSARAFLVSAALAASASWLYPSAAPAALMMDVYASFYNGAPITPTKSVTVAAVGDTVTFQVRGVITGSDPTKFQVFDLAFGSMLSTGGTLRGDLLHETNQFNAPFTANGSSSGLSQDLDGDGDLDIGSNNNDEAAHFIVPRSGALVGPNSTAGFGPSVWTPRYEAFPTTPGTQHTYYLSIFVDFVVTGLGTATSVNFRPRLHPTGAVWVENAEEVITTGKTGTRVTYETGPQSVLGDPTTGYSAGAPVTVQVVPEPAALGVAATPLALLFARRRR